MEFSREECWNGLPRPPPGNLPDPEMEPISPTSSALQVDSSQLSHQGSPAGSTTLNTALCLSEPQFPRWQYGNRTTCPAEMLGACWGVSRDSTQPVCGMWWGGYLVLPVFASPGESSGQGDVLCGVILCVTQECPSSQTSYGSNGKGRRRRRVRGQELPAVTRQRAGCTPRRWSRELSENSVLQLAGFPKEDVLGKNPLLSMFPS